VAASAGLLLPTGKTSALLVRTGAPTLCGEAIQSGSQLNGLVEKKNATLLENKPGVGKEREATD